MLGQCILNTFFFAAKRGFIVKFKLQKALNLSAMAIQDLALKELKECIKGAIEDPVNDAPSWGTTLERSRATTEGSPWKGPATQLGTAPMGGFFPCPSVFGSDSVGLV